ncbi:MAG: hypothetical protein EOO09_06030 [Chitinophagaceae bacterium]|nr:MAG: hypothetical protein EOO09_06030 [Chitinophagaceae bacterium]
MFRKIQADKWRHVIAGIPMGFLLQGAALWYLPLRAYIVTSLVLLVVVLISYGFELFSKITGRGHYEVADAVFTVVGGIIGIVLATALLYVTG